MAVELPRWLQLDPTEHANKLIAGYGQGRAAGAGRLSAEEHEIDREDDATQRAEALAAQREQAAAMMAYRQQAQDEETRQFNEVQRIRQRQAEIAAREASIQLEGQRGFDQDFQALVEQGLSPTQAMAQAFPKHASKMLYKDQWKIPNAVKQSQGIQPPIFGKSPEGIQFIQDPSTGHATPIPAAALGAAALGGPGGAVTKPMQTKLQGSLLSGEKAVELGVDLWGKLDPESIGAKGVFNRVVLNEGLAQVFPGMKKDDVANVQALLGNFNEKAVQAITASGDKRVSDKDMARYQKMLPKMTAGESLDSARTKISTFMNELRNEAKKDAERLGVPPPDWTFTKAEIVGAFKSGKITRDQAALLLKRYHTKDEE